MKGNYNGTVASQKVRARIVHTEFYLLTRIYIANEISFLLLSVFHKRRMIDSYVTSRFCFTLFDDFTWSVKGLSSCSFPTEDNIIINSLCISQKENFLVSSYLKNHLQKSDESYFRHLCRLIHNFDEQNYYNKIFICEIFKISLSFRSLIFCLK